MTGMMFDLTTDLFHKSQVIYIILSIFHIYLQPSLQHPGQLKKRGGGDLQNKTQHIYTGNCLLKLKLKGIFSPLQDIVRARKHHPDIYIHMLNSRCARHVHTQTHCAALMRMYSPSVSLFLAPSGNIKFNERFAISDPNEEA